MAKGERKDADAEVVPLVKGRRCPLCGRPTTVRYRPFCSRRCADRDLGHWISGDYRIAGAGDEAEEAEEADVEEGGGGDAPGD